MTFVSSYSSPSQGLAAGIITKLVAKGITVKLEEEPLLFCVGSFLEDHSFKAAEEKPSFVWMKLFT